MIIMNKFFCYYIFCMICTCNLVWGRPLHYILVWHNVFLPHLYNRQNLGTEVDQDEIDELPPSVTVELQVYCPEFEEFARTVLESASYDSLVGDVGAALDLYFPFLDSIHLIYSFHFLLRLKSILTSTVWSFKCLHKFLDQFKNVNLEHFFQIKST